MIVSPCGEPGTCLLTKCILSQNFLFGADGTKGDNRLSWCAKIPYLHLVSLSCLVLKLKLGSSNTKTFEFSNGGKNMHSYKTALGSICYFLSSFLCHPMIQMATNQGY